MAIADRNIEQQAPISAGEAAQAASSMTASSLGLVAQDGPGVAAASSSPSSSDLVASPSAMSTAASLKAVGGSKKASEIAGRISGSPKAAASKAAQAAGRALGGSSASIAAMGSETTRDASDEVAGEASGKAGTATKTLVGAAAAVAGKKPAGKAHAIARRGREKSWKAVTESWRGYASPAKRAAQKAPKAAYLSSGRGARVKKAATSAANAAQAAARRVAAGMRTVGNPVLAVSLSVILTFTLAVTALAAAGSSGGSGTGSLEGTEAEIAQALKGYGFSNVCTAAIIGNMYGESGETYNTRANDSTGAGDSIGVLQFTDSDDDNEKTLFIGWCSKTGKDKYSLDAQLEWAFSNEEGTSKGYWKSKNRWGTGLQKSGYYIGDCGVPESYRGKTTSAKQFEECSDVAFATYAWMACYERCRDYDCHYASGDPGSPIRLNKAREILNALSNATTYLGSGTAAQAASYALSKKGCPYVWGAIGPNTFDCSGLVYWAYNQAGVKISRLTAQGQYSSQTTHISKSQLQVGDLVFFGSSTSSIHHVGIYIGSNEFVHAPQSGDVVKTTSLSARRDLIACGRVKG